MNPIDLIKMYMSQGLTPKTLVEKMGMNNPIINNLIGMAQNGDTQGVENFARNIMKEKGRDFDKEFYNFKNTLNIK